MTLNIESDSEQRSPERAQPPARPRTPFYRRPWVLPLAIAVVAYIYLASEPFVGIPKAQQPLQPHENFSLYYPFLISHMVTGTIAMLTMVLQVWPKLRMDHPKVHRVSGRIYVVSVVISGLLGLVIVWWAPQVGKVGALCLLLFWLVTTVAAYRAVRRGDYNKHRRYMLYSFAVSANNMWAFFALLLIQRLQIPLDMVYYQEAARWIPWVGNVMLVQWWLYRTARRRTPKTAARTPVAAAGS